jgi:hypothetical protein
MGMWLDILWRHYILSLDKPASAHRNMQKLLIPAPIYSLDMSRQSALARRSRPVG